VLSIIFEISAILIDMQCHQTSRYQANQEGISTTKWLIQLGTQLCTRVPFFPVQYSLNTQVVTTKKGRPQN